MDTRYLAWDRLERFYTQHQSESTYPSLPSGASEEEISHIESILKIRLPLDVKTSYLRHNGGLLMPLVSKMTMLALQEMRKTWEILVDVAESGTWGDPQPYYFREDVRDDERQLSFIQPIWWQPQWIPCAEDRAGNLCCLDMAPAAGGTVGQMIDWDHDCGPSRVIAASFGDLLMRVAQAIEEGNH